MFYFFSFHRRLVRENKTTIENIEHNSDPHYESRYDISFWHNVYQVMGTNKWIWWIPINPASNAPEGDGIYFEKNYESSSEESDEEVEDDRPRNYYQNPAQNMDDENQPDMIERLTNGHDINGSQARNGNHRVSHGGGNGNTNGQADTMTIHNAGYQRQDHLNNIVLSDNTGQAYDNRGRDENRKVEDSKDEYSNRGDTLQPLQQDTRDRPYYDGPTQRTSARDQPTLTRGRNEGERADSKSSAGNL